jgi:hypothetical protein
VVHSFAAWRSFNLFVISIRWFSTSVFQFINSP